MRKQLAKCMIPNTYIKRSLGVGGYITGAFWQVSLAKLMSSQSVRDTGIKIRWGDIEEDKSISGLHTHVYMYLHKHVYTFTENLNQHTQKKNVRKKKKENKD